MPGTECIGPLFRSSTVSPIVRISGDCGAPRTHGMVMDLGFANATAVVVGGGRGMGNAAARCMADDGAKVAIVGRAQAVLDGAAEDLTARGSPDALGLVADTTDADQVQRVFDELA